MAAPVQSRLLNQLLWYAIANICVIGYMFWRYGDEYILFLIGPINGILAIKKNQPKLFFVWQSSVVLHFLICLMSVLPYLIERDEYISSTEVLIELSYPFFFMVCILYRMRKAGIKLYGIC